MARGDQLARQWKIIQSLISSRLGKSVSDLADDLDCHTRTVYRDLEALQAAGFPVYTNTVGGKSNWSLLDTVKHNIPIPFNLTELMALYFSRGLMGVLKDTVLYDSLESLFDKIKTTLPPTYIEYLEQMERSLAVSTKPYKQYGKLREMIDRISEAAIRKKIVAIVYYGMDDVRIFALNRIKAIHQTDETFEMPKDFNIDDFMKSSFGVFQGELVKVRIWFAADTAEYIREKNWHETQRIETLKDGSIIFEAVVAGTKEIEFWVLKWGAKARVLAPESLRDQIREEIEAMREVYKVP